MNQMKLKEHILPNILYTCIYESQSGCSTNVFIQLSFFHAWFTKTTKPISLSKVCKTHHLSGIMPDITSISIWLPTYRHWWQFCRQLCKNTSRLPILKCTSITVTQDVHYLEYTPFVLCNPSLGISTWQEVIDFLLDTLYSRHVTAEWVGHSVYTADRLQLSWL